MSEGGRKVLGLRTSFKDIGSAIFYWSFLFVFIIFFSNRVRAEFHSSVNVGLLGDFYFQRSMHNAQGFIDVLMENKGINDEFWLDIGAGALVGDNTRSYVKIPQFYYQIGFRDKAHLVLGRRLQKWSYLDDYWMMGMIQPLFKWNMALPEKQGLMGIFLTLPLTENIKLALFSSYVFLPSQGPVYELVNGEITSSNPWFMQPVRVIEFLNHETKLRYNVSSPKTTDVIFRPSYGGKVGTSYDKKAWLFNVLYFSKPKNDFIVPFNGHLNLTTFYGDITIQPTVARHNILGVDFGWNFDIFRILFSWLHESHISYRRLPDFTHPVIPEQDMFSLVQWVRLSDSQSLSMAYLQVIRESNKVEGLFSNSRIGTFLSRNTFENTLQFKWEGKFQRSGDQYRLRSYISWFQSLVVNHAWVSADIRWSFNRSIEFTGHCDFFGGYRQAPVDGDFISQFQDNDRCLVGGNYAF